MKKEKFHISITTNTTSDDYNTIGNYSEDELEFYESDKLKSKINIDLNNKKLIKENIDYRIEIEFNIDKETECYIYLKKEEKELKLRVKTLDYIYTDKILNIHYTILDSDERVFYEIRIGG